MRIELFGLPGSGKTFFAEQEARKRNIPLVTIQTAREKYFYLLFFAMRHPIVTARFFVLALQHSFPSRVLLRLKLRKILPEKLAQEEKARRYGECITDEGIMQLFLSLPERVLTDDDFAPFRRYLVARRVVVYSIETPADVRHARIAARRRVFRSRKKIGEKYMEHFLQTVEANAEVIAAFLRRHVASKTISGAGADIRSTTPSS